MPRGSAEDLGGGENPGGLHQGQHTTRPQASQGKKTRKIPPFHEILVGC